MKLEQECAQLDASGKPWIQTFTNRPFPVGDPRPSDFCLPDIGSHLSRLNRYTGAIQPEQYSVAEHSVRVAYYLRALVARELGTKDPHVLRAAFRAGLMHDAHEAYLNDLNSPVKRYLLSIGSTGYAELAERYDRLLAKRYGLDKFSIKPKPGPEHQHDYTPKPIDLIRDADLSLLDLERPQVMGKPPRPWSDLGVLPKVEKPFPNDPAFFQWGWRPNDARARFWRAAAQCGLSD